MDFLVNLFSSAATGGLLGGLTGLIGTWLKSRHERDMLKIRLDEKAKDREHDLAVMRLEGENAVRVADVHRQEADDTASASALAQSYKMEPKRYSQGMSFSNNWYGRILQSCVSFLMFMLDFFRGLMRPTLTMYMAVLNTLIYWQYQGILETYDIKPTPDQAHQITMYFIGTFAYLFTTAFVWWYGDRNRQQPPKGFWK